MEELIGYLEKCSEGVLRLLEGGKKRGLEELKKGHGRGTRKDLFQIVATSQRTFLALHDRCRTALRFARSEEAQEIALDVQYLLYLFSCQVYEIAFASEEADASVSFPPPEAYSRHYPGSGPEGQEGYRLFSRYFGDAVYSREKSSFDLETEIDMARKERLSSILQVAS